MNHEEFMKKVREIIAKHPELTLEQMEKAMITSLYPLIRDKIKK